MALGGVFAVSCLVAAPGWHLRSVPQPYTCAQPSRGPWVGVKVARMSDESGSESGRMAPAAVEESWAPAPADGTGTAAAMAEGQGPADGGADELADSTMDPILEDSDLARTVWVIDITKDDGSQDRLQVLFDGTGKAVWEGGPVPRSGVWSLRSDRLLFTRNFLLGVIGFKETYVASPTVDASDDLKLVTKGIVRGWGYFAPALKIGEFVATRKATNVGS